LKSRRPAGQPEVPIIFNLFPRYFKSIDEWAGVIPHIASMKFNYIFINPFHATGFSGSLYAIKNHYRINPLFLKSGQDGSDWRPLKKFIAVCKDSSLNIIMDLVINHTAFDSYLVKTHPEWYKRDAQNGLVCPHAIDPANADNVTVWGDLAEIDNYDSSDKKALWNYWDKLIAFFQEMGISGFRCDAAYQVPADLWKYLIAKAKNRHPRTMFLAETLGCTMDQIGQLRGTGFDYLFNSSKYWEFDKPWCFEQHAANKKIAPSISFPESHDTLRLASEKPGTVEVQKMRYAFAAVFSAGILMPTGYEFGAKNRIDVVHGSPKDVEQPQWDISKWITGMNGLKLSMPVFCEEGAWNVLSGYDKSFLFCKKTSDKDDLPAFVCVNKSMETGEEVADEDIPAEIKSCSKMIRPLEDPRKEIAISAPLMLKPADMILYLQ
jgi:starch synthase (maltosyl-transferring)